MSKNDFLNRLSKLLHMLKEDEVNDIISEYEQHIIMKVAEGQSEEEAIAAFGTVEELAAEILDAYHVKPDFKEKKTIDVLGKVQTESKKTMKNVGDAGKGILGKCSSGIKKMADACKNGFKKAASACKKWLLAPFLFLKRIFTKKNEETDQQSETSVKTRKEGRFGKGIIACLKWFIRLIKKVCYGCILLLFGSAGICLILVLGILTVLMVLGYPVTGITIVLLGSAMSVNAIAYFAGSKWRRI